MWKGAEGLERCGKMWKGESVERARRLPARICLSIPMTTWRARSRSSGMANRAPCGKQQWRGGMCLPCAVPGQPPCEHTRRVKPSLQCHGNPWSRGGKPTSCKWQAWLQMLHFFRAHFALLNSHRVGKMQSVFGPMKRSVFPNRRNNRKLPHTMPQWLQVELALMDRLLAGLWRPMLMETALMEQLLAGRWRPMAQMTQWCTARKWIGALPLHGQSNQFLETIGLCRTRASSYW